MVGILLDVEIFRHLSKIVFFRKELILKAIDNSSGQRQNKVKRCIGLKNGPVSNGQRWAFETSDATWSQKFTLVYT